MQQPDPARAILGTYQKVPCGCDFWAELVSGEQTLIVRPHQQDCPFFLRMLAEARKRSKPTHYLGFHG